MRLGEHARFAATGPVMDAVRRCASHRWLLLGLRADVRLANLVGRRKGENRRAENQHRQPEHASSRTSASAQSATSRSSAPQIDSHNLT